MSIDVKEPEPANGIPEWKGMSMNEIRKSRGIYEYQEHPPIVASSHHTVLFAVFINIIEIIQFTILYYPLNTVTR